MKIIDVYIYAPDYDANSGGSVVLHRLCHLINQVDGFNAYLVPRKGELIHLYPFQKCLRSILLTCYLYFKRFKKFKMNPLWDTSVKKLSKITNNKAIAVYPEVTFGNPLQAKNVVRWFLHQPGHFCKAFQFAPDELYFKFNSAIKDFNYCYSKTSENELKVIYYPLDIYNTENITERTIDCHLVRKGKHKEKIHSENSVEIDQMTHEEIASIFKKSRRFISYDDYTAYSIFAILCGCESIVIPDENCSKEDWYPNETDRFGIAYGLDESELDWASKTKAKVLEHIHREHERSLQSVNSFLKESSLHFKL